MKIGDSVYVHGYVDEIRKDTVIIRNAGGYFGTAPSEIVKMPTSVCDLCIHNPPSSMDGKPCCMCVAQEKPKDN